MKFLTLSLLILTFACTQATEESSQRANDPANIQVVLSGDFADPSIVKDGDDYYMTNTSTNYFPGLRIWHSKDLTNWDPIGYALNTFVGEVWAPDFVKHGSKFYIYFPAYPGTNWVVTADSPYGPWSDPIDLKVKGIDPGHISTPDGKRFLYFNNGNVAELNEDGLSLKEEPKHVYDGWQYPDDWAVECMCAESPKLNYINGYYYLTTAQGGTAGPSTSHMVVQARSKNVLGPWENSPHNPIVHTYSSEENYWSKGHGTIVEAPAGGFEIFYHAYQKSELAHGRQVLKEKIILNDDGWFELDRDKEVEPIVELINNFNVTSDDFEGEILKEQWQFTNVFDLEEVVLENGKLVVNSTSDTLKVMHAIVHTPDYEVTIKMEREGDVEAGLVIFYREHAYRGIRVKGREVMRVGTHLPYGSPTLKDIESNYLKMTVKDYDVSFAYSPDGETWTGYPNSMNIEGFQHNVMGKFSSLKPGVYWKGNGTVRFDDFTFKEF